MITFGSWRRAHLWSRNYHPDDWNSQGDDGMYLLGGWQAGNKHWCSCSSGFARLKQQHSVNCTRELCELLHWVHLVQCPRLYLGPWTFVVVFFPFIHPWSTWGESWASQELGGSLAIGQGWPTTAIDNQQSKLHPRLDSEGNEGINAWKWELLS